MNYINYGKAICYSGYRKGQSPVHKNYPSYDEVVEDLKILESSWDYIRMYDSGPHAKTTLEAIRNEGINLKVLLGMDLLGEISNPQCTWGGQYTTEEIASNIKYNQQQLHQIIDLAEEYKDILIGVSAGNEAVPEWNENLLSPGRVLYFARQLKEYTDVPVTYCDNCFYWQNTLKEVADTVDFISIHIYPVWLGNNVEESITISKQDYHTVKSLYPNKQVIITEAGWPTASNGNAIPTEYANQINQLRYVQEIDTWSEQHNVPVFFFEAFDELWKGSDDITEPEKNWGFYYDSRKPKTIAKL